MSGKRESAYLVKDFNERSARGWISNNLELLFWITAIVLLYYMPVSDDHYSLCVRGMLGFDSCMGCGIGHSIHSYLHFDFNEGWEHHYMGAFAIPVILYRIYKLIQLNFKT